MKNLPPTNLLAEFAPLEVWDEAIKQAGRSPHKRHRTGAVIFDHLYNDEIKSKGCSHTHDGGMAIGSIHAEHHALRDYRGSSERVSICIVTLTKTGNFARSSRPCMSCVRQLSGRVQNVLYCEQGNDGDWIINFESVKHLSERSNGQLAKYANRMKI